MPKSKFVRLVGILLTDHLAKIYTYLLDEFVTEVSNKKTIL